MAEPDSTWGGSSALTYVSVTNATSLLSTTVIDYAAWSSATTIQQGAALVQAARDIDALQFIGTRYYYNQNLEMPRKLETSFPWDYVTNVGTTAGGDIEQTRMQFKVEQACALQALKLLREGGRNVHQERQASGISNWSESLGPMSQSVTYGKSAASSGAGATAKLAPEALALLADYRGSKRLWRA